MDPETYLQMLSATSISSEMAFPKAEFLERVAKIRMGMDEEGLDALLVTFPPNLYYVSGYYTFGTSNYACLVLPGMVFHLPINLLAPGEFGVGLSETMVVTETGCEILTSEERDLLIVPA